MLSPFLLSLLAIIFWFDNSIEAVVLNRAQLELWCPDFNTTGSIILNYRSISSIEVNTFSQLTQLKKLDLSNNQLSSLDPNTFSDLANLNELRLERNN